MWLWPLTAFLSVCIIVGGLIYLTSGPKPVGVAASDSAQPPIGTKARERDAQSRESDALARSRRKLTLDQAEDLIGRIGELETAVNRFENEVAGLLDNDEGKALASNRAFVSAYRSVMDEARPSKREVEAFQARVIELLKPARDAEDRGGSYIPSEEVTAQLDREKELVGKALKSLKDALSLIDGLRAEAKRGGARGTATLKETIAAAQAQEAKERAETIDAAARKAREEETRKLAEAKAESVRLEGEKQRELELARRTTALEAKERERLLTLAKDAAVQADFQCFLAKGKWTFPDIGPINSNARGPGNVGYSERIAPASFSRLFQGGWLKDEEAFAVTRSGFVPTKVNFGIYNDRPVVPYPATEEDWERTRRLFERFKELAPVWVEMGLLGK